MIFKSNEYGGDDVANETEQADTPIHLERLNVVYSVDNWYEKWLLLLSIFSIHIQYQISLNLYRSVPFRFQSETWIVKRLIAEFLL